VEVECNRSNGARLYEEENQDVCANLARGLALDERLKLGALVPPPRRAPGSRMGGSWGPTITSGAGDPRRDCISAYRATKTGEVT